MKEAGVSLVMMTGGLGLFLEPGGLPLGFLPVVGVVSMAMPLSLLLFDLRFEDVEAQALTMTDGVIERVGGWSEEDEEVTGAA